MSRVLVVNPDSYEDLTAEFEEEGIEYDRATDEEASELLTLVGYDAVVGPAQEKYLRFIGEDTSFIAYDEADRVADDSLTGEADFDARMVAGYLGKEGYESYTRDLTDLAESHDDKDLFMSMLVHDVKNDIQLIQGYLDRMDVEETQEREKNVIDDHTSSIDNLMDTIATVRELDSEEEEENVSLSNIFRTLEDSYETRAAENDIEMNFDIDEEITVSAGPLLKDMYCQLMENSINHSRGSQIRVSAEDGERPLVVFEDDGVGIPESIKDNLFEKGVKGNKTGNTGIGTTLADRIADRYDIDIEVDDSELGGAEFRIHHQPPF